MFLTFACFHCIQTEVTTSFFVALNVIRVLLDHWNDLEKHNVVHPSPLCVSCLSQSIDLSFFLSPVTIAPTLQCFEIADALLINFGCSGAPYAIQNATCIYDDGRPSEACELR